MRVNRDMSFKIYLSSLINEMYNDEDNQAVAIEIYKHFFHARNAKKRKIINVLKLKERQSHIRPALYSEIWIDLYIENDFFLTFRMKRLTFQHLLETLMQQSEMQKV